MLDSLRKVAARLLGTATDDRARREPRRLALDDVPHLGLVYPSVESIAITLRVESPDRQHCSITHTRTFADRSRADFRFRCKNPACVQGGFDLSELIDRAVGAQRDTVTGTRICDGVESPRGTYHSNCMHELSYRIAIRYQQH